MRLIRTAAMLLSALAAVSCVVASNRDLHQKSLHPPSDTALATEIPKIISFAKSTPAPQRPEGLSEFTCVPESMGSWFTLLCEFVHSPTPDQIKKVVADIEAVKDPPVHSADIVDNGVREEYASANKAWSVQGPPSSGLGKYRIQVEFRVSGHDQYISVVFWK